jgi:hypothetical protein
MATHSNFCATSVFNARPWHSVTKDAVKRNQFGGTFGGPIIRDRTFIFAAFQQTYQRNFLLPIGLGTQRGSARAKATDPSVIALLKGIPLGILQLVTQTD